jgi:transcription elongation factor GreA
MTKKEYYLTPEGADNIRAELQVLKDVKRAELSARLRHAISMGDLSENADYIATKEEQAFVEGKILELETLLREAIIIEGNGVTDRVGLGSVVRITDVNSETLEYKIVGAKEADPRNGKISNESPIGQALLGKQKGEVTTARTPAGEIKFTIVEILSH